MLDPQQFVQRWSDSQLGERQGYQSHFIDLCELVNHPHPVAVDQQGAEFCFEKSLLTIKGAKGFADVWYRNHFAWEYKGKHKDLDAAYAQLLSYRQGLGNPPLLVVCDFLEFRIYPQWPNMDGKPIVFYNHDLLEDKTRRLITWLLEDPQQFLTLYQADLETRGKITRDIAEKFAHLAGLMRDHSDWNAIQIARFLTKLAFALFVEDVGLLPTVGTQPVFRYIADTFADTESEGFEAVLGELFRAMDGRQGHYQGKSVPWFNGGLFEESRPDADDGLEVLDLTKIPGAVAILGDVSEADWREVNPTIFGTLFEGALDESKRAQLGAHYTDEPDIRLVVEPVLMQPLYRQWEQVQAEAEPLLQAYLTETAPKLKEQARTKLIALHDGMMHTLESIRVLDPACGSGNFLYVSLRLMKDLEAQVRRYFAPLNLPFRDVVTPRQLYGIEKDEFAAKLAHVVVWIGYLQWRYASEGVLHPKHPKRPDHPHMLPHPIIKDKLNPDEPDRIICADAIMRYDADGQPYEPEWPTVDVIMGNPPFLGDKKMRSEMGDEYVDSLRRLYEGRVPGGADLVMYWYERGRTHIEEKHAKRAGFLATNSIRQGANRLVLDRIKQTGDIFMAWGDRPWVLEGAAVRISIVGFDDGTIKDYRLDGAPVDHINSDLQNTIDATKARLQPENAGIAFQGPVKVGAFDITEQLAQSLLNSTNPTGVNNEDVVRPWINGSDIVGRSRNMWIIDFGDKDESVAAEYVDPFEYIKTKVKPQRDNVKRTRRREKWWQHGETVPGLRAALLPLRRYIATPRVATHRIFVWAKPEVLPDSRVLAIARDDDYFFGLLHSYIHEIWSIRLASWHGVGNDPTYNAQSCFETFPFPTPPGKEETTTAAYQAISAAAKELHERRNSWLNPAEYASLDADEQGKTMAEFTLTNLYNVLQEYRSNKQNGKNGPAKANKANTFVADLAELHDALDQAVLAAYGWEDLVGRLRTPDGDEELLRRLLALNLQRAGA